MSGWIKLHRSIQEHWIWRDEKKLKWWLDILLIVNHDDNKVNIGNSLIDCKRGQTVMSLHNFSERWLVSRDTARNFLGLLKKDGMITIEGLIKTTRITICNYECYQGDLHDDQTQGKRKANARLHKQEGIKNDKEDIDAEKTETKEKKKFTPPDIQEVKEYFKEKGYKSETAQKAFDYYSVNNWKDRSGSQVNNWKQKMIAVWFKPENLIDQAAQHGPRALTYSVNPK